MPFVKRVAGQIVSAYGIAQPDQPELEEIAEDSAEYVAFTSWTTAPRPSLAQQILADPEQLAELKRALGL